MAERTESVILDFEVDFEDSIESIESLTKANKELREERKKLNLQNADDVKRINQINAQLDENTKKIVANSSAVEKQRANIGNYKSALDGVHPALGKVGEGLEAGTSGFKAMTLQALRFIATPIGAILAALVTVFTLLKTAISANEQVFDKFENITNAVGVVVNVLVNRVGKLGEALIALASGNFHEAVNLTSQAFSGLGDEIENAVRQGQLYLDLSRDLEDAQRALRIETVRTENQIKLLDQAAKNRNLTLDQQEEKLREALALQGEIIAKREENAQKDLIITAKQIALERSLQQTAEETFDQFVDRLLTGGIISGEQADKIVDKIEALEQARGGALAFQQKLENDLAAVQLKRAEALEKQNAALAEQAALQRANERAANRIDSPTADPLIGAFQTRANTIVNIEDRMQADLEKRRKEADAAERQRIKAGEEYVREVEAAKLGIISNAVGTAADLFEQDSAAHKGLASAQALINTYLAATAALASGSKINPVFGIISAAIAVANGLASVARINGVEFAEGGWTGPGGKWDVAGVVHKDEYVVPKRVNNNPMAAPHIQALENMRLRPYADGGLVASAVTSPVNQQMELLNIVKALPPQELSVKEVSTVQKRIRVKEQLSKR